MTVASVITLSRIALIPVFMGFMLWDQVVGTTVALVIFVVASITDGVDGYVARRFNQVTNFGKFIDPLADKLLVCAAILIFVQTGKMSCIPAMIIVAREFLVTSLRVVAMADGHVLSAGFSGKAKTTIQIVCIIIMLTDWAASVSFNGVMLNDYAVWVMTAVTIWSGIDYMIDNRKFLISSGRSKS